MGIDKLLKEKVIRKANMESDLALLRKLHEEEHNDWATLVKNSYTNVPSTKDQAQNSSVSSAQYYRSVLNPENSQSSITSGVMPLPFQFPIIQNDSLDIVKDCCSRCMQSVTSVSLIRFAQS